MLYLVIGAVVAVYIVLGMLYESFIHPDHDSFDPALGGRRAKILGPAGSSRPN